MDARGQDRCYEIFRRYFRVQDPRLGGESMVCKSNLRKKKRKEIKESRLKNVNGIK